MGRPILITIVGIIYLIEALVLIAIGIYALVSGVRIDPWEFDIPLKTLCYVMIIVGFIYAIIAVGLIKGITIFWYLGVIGFFLSIISGVWSIIDARSWGAVIIVVINAALIYYMFTEKVKQHFGV